MPKTYKIYKCTNNINNKIYIGFTHKKLKNRINEHKSSAENDSNYLLHKAIRKSAQLRKGKPSWNKGKKQTWVNGGIQCKGKTWVKDEITDKRVWI